jgi:integrase
MTGTPLTAYLSRLGMAGFRPRTVDSRRAWLLLMALGGLRCIEVAGLRPVDLIPADTGTLLYLRECKGGGTATVPAHPTVLEALAVLPIRNGLWWSVKPELVSAQVGRHFKECQVDGGAHRLRHFAGTAFYKASGHDLIATATLLRHANVQTSMVYAQLDPTRPAQVVNAVPLRLVEGEAS